MTRILQILKKQEGGKLHRNPNETDITTGYGIYRGKHPSASIFQYIDAVASSLGINKASSEWSSEDITRINHYISPVEELKLSESFYSQYLRFDIDSLPEPLKTSYGSSYVNTGSGANKALKQSINYMIGQYFDKLSQSRVGIDSTIDEKTLRAIDFLNFEISNKFNADYSSIWNDVFLDYMQEHYKNIVKSNPEQYSKYEDGWNNRAKSLRSNKTRITKAISNPYTLLKEYHKKKDQEVKTYQFVPVKYKSKFYYVRFEDVNNAPEFIEKYKIQPIKVEKIEDIKNIYIKSNHPYNELNDRMLEAYGQKVENRIENAEFLRKKKKLKHQQTIIINNNNLVNTNSEETRDDELSMDSTKLIKIVNR